MFVSLIYSNRVKTIFYCAKNWKSTLRTFQTGSAFGSRLTSQSCPIGSTTSDSSIETCWRSICQHQATTPWFWCVDHRPWSTLPVYQIWSSSATPQTWDSPTRDSIKRKSWWMDSHFLDFMLLLFKRFNRKFYLF